MLPSGSILASAESVALDYWFSAKVKASWPRATRAAWLAGLHSSSDEQLMEKVR